MSIVKLTVIVLAVNETHSLEHIIKTLTKFDYFIEKILIVSPVFITAECKKTQSQLKEKNNKIETLIQSKEFPGMGGAIKFSIQFIETEYFCWIDGDGETDPEYLEEMYESVIKDKSIDIVNASRFKNNDIIIKDYGFFSSIFTYLFQLLCRLFFEKKITDFTVAYRLYKTEYFKKFDFINNNQNFCLETLLVPLALNSPVIKEIYYKWSKRSDGMSSNNMLNKFSYFRIFYYAFILQVKKIFNNK